MQACRDARRGCRSWFGSLPGGRKGRRVGRPRFGSRRDSRASVRLTRNGLPVTSGGVRVAKVGDVALVWGRVLGCVPCSAAVVREAAAGTTRRLWSRWQTHRYPRAPTMSGSASAWRAWPSCPPGGVASEPSLPAWEGEGVGQGTEVTGREDEGVEQGRQGRAPGSLSAIAGSPIPAWTPIAGWPTPSLAIARGVYVGDLGRVRSGPDPAGDVGGRRRLVDTGGVVAAEGAGLPPDGGGGRWLVPLEPAVLGVWGQLRGEAPGGQVLDLYAVWHHRRSGPERRQEHSG